MSSERAPVGRRHALVAGAVVLVAGAVSATLFYLPLGFAPGEAVAVGALSAIALLVRTVLDDATFGAGD